MGIHAQAARNRFVFILLVGIFSLSSLRCLFQLSFLLEHFWVWLRTRPAPLCLAQPSPSIPSKRIKLALS